MLSQIMKNILFIFGTRPEGIKLAPLALELRKYPDVFEVKICVTGQHREMLQQVLSFFGLEPDVDLGVMKAGQSLFDVTAECLVRLQGVIEDSKPDWIIVQGDTTSVFAASLAAFYSKIKVAHVEAGLRSFQMYSPFPEEMNRVLTTRLAELHLTPTESARKNLLKEGVSADSIRVVGNTVIDALLHGVSVVKERKKDDFGSSFSGIDPQAFSRKIILVTGHRRENFGEPFANMCRAFKQLALRGDVSILYPVHLNPNVRLPVREILEETPNVYLTEPLDYPAFIWLMNKSYLVLTDSGGVQEEAPSLGKPVLVMRDVTERIEGVEAGTARLVGTASESIVREVSGLLDDPSQYRAMAGASNPYGDGSASRRIREVLNEYD